MWLIYSYHIQIIDLILFMFFSLFVSSLCFFFFVFSLFHFVALQSWLPGNTKMLFNPWNIENPVFIKSFCLLCFCFRHYVCFTRINLRLKLNYDIVNLCCFYEIYILYYTYYISSYNNLLYSIYMRTLD